MQAAQERLETPREIGRFWKKVVCDDVSDCWVWTASRTRGDRGEYRGGYGMFGLRGKHPMAHRIAYTTWRGGIPDGLELDHVVCDNRACVNPWHCKPATGRENTLRGRSLSAINARKTQCIRGHSWERPGSFWWIQKGKRKGRVCKQCRADWQRTPEGRAKVNAAARRYHARHRARRLQGV